jgi:hypothetical protein
MFKSVMQRPVSKNSDIFGKLWRFWIDNNGSNYYIAALPAAN